MKTSLRLAIMLLVLLPVITLAAVPTNDELNSTEQIRSDINTVNTTSNTNKSNSVKSPEIGSGTYDSSGNTRLPTFGPTGESGDGGEFVVVEYADGGLVTCQGPDCNACKLVEMVNKIVNFLIVLLTILATFVLVIAGFRMVTSGGNSSAWDSAKQSFLNVIIGFILVLAAWLIVDTILKALTGTGLEVWGVITC